MIFKFLLVLGTLTVSARAGVVSAPLAVAPYATSYAAHVTHHSVAAPIVTAQAAPIVTAHAAPLVAAPAASYVAAPVFSAPAAPLVAAPLSAPLVSSVVSPFVSRGNVLLK